MAFIPVTRDNLIPAIIEGCGDVAAANLTITPERQQQVDFTDPLAIGIREVVVAGPNAPALSRIINYDTNLKINWVTLLMVFGW